MNQNQSSHLTEGVIPSICRLKDKLLDLFRSAERTRLLVLLGVIGMGMIFCSELVSSSDSESREDTSTPLCRQEMESSEGYVRNLEQRLQEMISQIDGVGECSVMVTLKESSRSVFASEDKISQEQGEGRSDHSSEKKLVLLEDENGVGYPVVETTLSPQIKGVMVVCKGAKSAKVCQQVTEAVTTVLGIRSIQVCISPKGRER